MLAPPTRHYGSLTLFLIAIFAFSPEYGTAQPISISLKSVDGYVYKMAYGEIEVNASVDQVYEYLDDADSYKDWVHKLRVGHVLFKEDNEAYYLLSYKTKLLGLIGPKDPYTIAHTLSSRDPNTGIVTITLIDNNEPPPFDFNRSLISRQWKRVKSSYAKWTLTPVDNGRTKIEYEVSVDPGVKKFYRKFIDPNNEKFTEETLKNIRREINKRYS